MTCTRCGATIPVGDRFCSVCGTPVQVAQPAPQPQPQAWPQQPAPQPQQWSQPMPQPQPWPQTVQTPYPQAVRYAGFWRRFVAAVVDGLVVGIVWFVLSGLYDFAAAAFLEGTAFSPGGAALERALWLSGAGRWLLLALVIFGYFVLMESTTRGASLGKMLLRIRVARADGRRTGLGHSLARTALKPISALPLMLGFVIAGWNRKKRALHDLLSGCIVVRV